MTELNPSGIIAKLEEDGPDAVRKKLQQNVYADYKLPIIRRWLKGEFKKAVEVPEKAAPVDAPTGEPTESTGEDTVETVSESGQWPDAETLELANKTDEEYKAADSGIKRKITMARKKVDAAKE